MGKIKPVFGKVFTRSRELQSLPKPGGDPTHLTRAKWQGIV
jgi:hypothetical protein